MKQINGVSSIEYGVWRIEYGVLSMWKYVLVVISCTVVFVNPSESQIENVPINNQVYEFLNRMSVKDILPEYSNSVLPLSRKDVAGFIEHVEAKKEDLSLAELEYLQKFVQEFAHEIDRENERPFVLFRDGFKEDMFSDKEKYLYAYSDSVASLYVEFLGTLEHRRTTGDSFGSTHASFEQHGGRIRGTIKQRLGYSLQGTNGTLFGDRDFALSDPRLRGNAKFNNFRTPYFDFAEAYISADLSWFNLEFGREYTLVGTGYSDRLLLSENAPLFDFLRIDAHYKAVSLMFMHASILHDSIQAPGLVIDEPPGSTKYLTLHRLQFSFSGKLNVGVSEMTIYQRYSPEFAYLNPINFYKSAEHSLRDRDNSFLNFDIEAFPIKGLKLYGTWLIDDIDFSKLGSGWWGNEFAWQGGMYIAGAAGVSNMDAVVEYTRIEPYVYSNRIAGNDYTHNNVGLGHHLNPNSDEWFLQLSYRPSRMLRLWTTLTRERHGENIVGTNGDVSQNVGGSALQGHRSADPETAFFLDGNLVTKERLQLRVALEPINNIYLLGVYEVRRTSDNTSGASQIDQYGSLQLRVEY